MKAATLFSGIGAPECAMPGWDWLWHAEVEKFPSAVMAARHPKSVNLGDVNAEDFVERAEKIGRPDILVFGSPCQDFSVAGRRVGLDGDRGNLALVALGVAAKLRPRWVVFENVPGLLSSRSGSAAAEGEIRGRAERGEAGIGAAVEADEDSDFAAFLSLIQECGYLGCYRIVDAQFAGVPQRRRRVFAVFHLGDWRPAAAVLLEPESLRGDHPPGREAGKGVAGTISARSAGGGGLGTDFDLSGGLDESSGQGLRVRGMQGDQRGDVVADVRMVRGAPDAFNNQGHGWWNGSDVAQTVRSGDGAGGGAARESTLIAGTLGTRSAAHPGGTKSEADFLVPAAFGGNNTSGPIEAATAVRAKGGSGHGDFESETFVVLGANSDRTAGGPGPCIAFTAKDWGGVAAPDQTPTLRAMGGDDSHDNGGGQIAIAFDCKAGGDTTFAIGDQAGALRASHGGAHAAIAVNLRGREGGAMPEIGGAASLRSPSGGSSRSYVFKPSHYTRDKDSGPEETCPPLTAEADRGDQEPVLFAASSVRRLTPRECERLQAYPDDFTLITYRGKPAADDPRYKALGNSMCVADVRWILTRLEQVDSFLRSIAAP